MVHHHFYWQHVGLRNFSRQRDRSRCMRCDHCVCALWLPATVQHACLAPSHYLIQCFICVNWAPGNKYLKEVWLQIQLISHRIMNLNGGHLHGLVGLTPYRWLLLKISRAFSRTSAGPLFTKGQDILPRKLMKPREVLKLRGWMLWWSYRYEIWRASWQCSCRVACEIWKWLEKSKPEFRGFKTSRDLDVRPLSE